MLLCFNCYIMLCWLLLKRQNAAPRSSRCNKCNSYMEIGAVNWKKQWNKKGESEEKKPDIVRVKKKNVDWFRLEWSGRLAMNWTISKMCKFFSFSFCGSRLHTPYILAGVHSFGADRSVVGQLVINYHYMHTNVVAIVMNCTKAIYRRKYLNAII